MTCHPAFDLSVPRRRAAAPKAVADIACQPDFAIWNSDV